MTTGRGTRHSSPAKSTNWAFGCTPRGTRPAAGNWPLTGPKPWTLPSPDGGPAGSAEGGQEAKPPDHGGAATYPESVSAAPDTGLDVLQGCQIVSVRFAADDGECLHHVSQID